MRTTVTLDEDVLSAAKGLARAKSVSLGAAISELVRRGLEQARITTDEEGFPIFAVSPGARPITLEDVKRLEDEP